MISGAARPVLSTAAMLATAVAVVVHPIIPKLPDITLPAMFPPAAAIHSAAADIIAAGALTLPTVHAVQQAITAFGDDVVHARPDLAADIPPLSAVSPSEVLRTIEAAPMSGAAAVGAAVTTTVVGANPGAGSQTPQPVAPPQLQSAAQPPTAILRSDPPTAPEPSGRAPSRTDMPRQVAGTPRIGHPQPPTSNAPHNVSPAAARPVTGGPATGHGGPPPGPHN